MRLPLPLTLCLLALPGSTLAAQGLRPAPAGVWLAPSASWHTGTPSPLDQHARGSGCGDSCALGATIGIIAGGVAGAFVSALSGSRTGWPILGCVIAGGFTGAMIGSGLDDDTPPQVDSTRVVGS